MAATPPMGRREVKGSDQVDGELAKFVQAVASCAERGMTPEALHAAVSEKQSALLSVFDEFMREARRGGALSQTRADDWKAKGNAAFKKKSYEEAVFCYTRALHDSSDPAATAAALNNRATCLFHMGLHRNAVVDATAALRASPGFTKAHYRRGHALLKLGHKAEGELEISRAEPDAGAPSAAAEVEAVEALCARLEAEGLWESAGLPKVSAKVAVEATPDQGRRIVAKKAVEPGEVLVEEDCFAAALRPEHLLTHCDWCLQHTPNLLPARMLAPTLRDAPQQRSRGLYCSARCAESAHAEYLEMELAHPFFLVCPLDCVLACRILLRQLRRRRSSAGEEGEEGEGAGREQGFPAGLSEALEGHSHETEATLSIGGNETPVAVLAYHSGALAALLHCAAGNAAAAAAVGEAGAHGEVKSKAAVEAEATVSVPELWDAAERLVRVMRQVLTNGVAVSKILTLPRAEGVQGTAGTPAAMHSTEQRAVAAALYERCALANHSCAPNAFLNFEGAPHAAFRRVRLRSTRLIVAGEAVTLCYGPHKNKIHSARKRREKLQEQYNFLCHCEACSNEQDDLVSEEKEELMKRASNYYQKGRKMMRDGRPADAIPALEMSLDLLLNQIFVGEHRSSFVVGKTHDAAAECYAALGHYGKALGHCKRSVENLIAVNGPCEVETAHEYLKLSGLAAQAGEHAEAREALDASKKIMRVYYGDVELPEVAECEAALAVLAQRQQ